jgi:CRP-like cAMP-binding protein
MYSNNLNFDELYSCINNEDLEKILCNNCIKLFFQKGNVIFEEGTLLKGIYFIKSGFAKSFKLGIHGKEQIFSFYKKGDIIGFDSLIINHPTNYSVSAIEKIEVIFISALFVKKEFNENIKFRRYVLSTVSKSLKEANELLINMIQKKNSLRVLELIEQLNLEFDKDTDGYINFPLKRTDLANRIGACQGSVIRILSSLINKKIIKTKGTKIKLI